MWQIGGKACQSRLLVGTAGFPSLAILTQAIAAAETNIITVSLKREDPKNNGGQHFWQAIQALGCHILPNTAGCRKAKDAVYLAQLSQEIFATPWVKLEVIGDELTLQPHPLELLKAAEQLLNLGFEVFPYCTEDFVLGKALYDLGCKILMPWGSPIGSGKGLLNPYHLTNLRQRLPEATLIVDAGIGSPMHAVHAMQLGYDGVLCNSAIARAHDPIQMAHAFNLAVRSGRLAYEAGMMPESDLALSATALEETLFWQTV